MQRNSGIVIKVFRGITYVIAKQKASRVRNFPIFQEKRIKRKKKKLNFCHRIAEKILKIGQGYFKSIINTPIN